MDYAIKFDENGRRTSTYPIDSTVSQEKLAEWVADGYLVISENDWEYYAGMHGNGQNGTGYIRDPQTGKPVDAPAYVPTKDEQAKILFNACQRDLETIDKQVINAVAMEDDELLADLRQERQERIEQYQQDIDKLKGGDS